jgi:hypothetical protein
MKAARLLSNRFHLMLLHAGDHSSLPLLLHKASGTKLYYHTNRNEQALTMIKLPTVIFSERGMQKTCREAQALCGCISFSLDTLKRAVALVHGVRTERLCQDPPYGGYTPCFRILGSQAVCKIKTSSGFL